MRARQRNYLGKIERSAKSLLGLVNDILDFSKIEADKIELERVEFQLGEVLDDLSNLVALPAEAKGLDLVFEVQPGMPRGLVGDPLRLGQVLVNLVGNAVKFTDRGRVTLAIERVGAAPDTLALRFTVSDSGIGMTPQHLARLFQPFEQADASTSRQHGGTGLGLVISQRLVETMGGTLAVTSVPGHGSRFAFDIAFGVLPPAPPEAAEPTDARQAAAPRRTRLHGARVLLVDDNEINRELALEILGDAGMLVTQAVHGVQALELLHARPFDIVLMDCQMPVMDGYEATVAIRREARWAALPVIAMTANVMSGDRERALASGMNDHIAKPIDIDAMFATLSRWLPAEPISATPPLPPPPPA